MTVAASLTVLDYLGVFVFAVTGALTAARKGMDPFGFVVLALMPAVGGGTLRDLLLGTDVFWLVDTSYLFITVSAALLTFFAHRHIGARLVVLTWLDAVGLSVFAVMGAAKTLAVLGDPVVAVVLGVVTAVAGGIIRDVIAGEQPLVLHREVYATAAFAGAVTFVLVDGLTEPGALWTGMLVALVTRGLGITRGWSLPGTRSGP